MSYNVEVCTQDYSIFSLNHFQSEHTNDNTLELICINIYFKILTKTKQITSKYQ
jgi:hypothetical protein